MKELLDRLLNLRGKIERGNHLSILFLIYLYITLVILFFGGLSAERALPYCITRIHTLHCTRRTMRGAQEYCQNVHSITWLKHTGFSLGSWTYELWYALFREPGWDPNVLWPFLVMGLLRYRI